MRDEMIYELNYGWASPLDEYKELNGRTVESIEIVVAHLSLSLHFRSSWSPRTTSD